MKSTEFPFFNNNPEEKEPKLFERDINYKVDIFDLDVTEHYRGLGRHEFVIIGYYADFQPNKVYYINILNDIKN